MKWGSFSPGLLGKLIGPSSAASSDHSVKWPLGLVHCPAVSRDLCFSTHTHLSLTSLLSRFLSPGVK